MKQQKNGLRDQLPKDFEQKKTALWCQGHQSVATLCGSLQGSANALVVEAGERWPLKTQKIAQKSKKKNSRKSEIQSVWDESKSQQHI
jgi:hypothetical protein